MHAPRWMSQVLFAAGIYNLVWGTLTVLFPGVTYALTGLPPLNLPMIWACLGMVIGVYGIGYLIAARDPYRHWPIVFVGLLGKFFGPVGFFLHWSLGLAPGDMIWALLPNDLVWWIPFTAILYGAFKHELDPQPDPTAPVPTWETAVAAAVDQHGVTLKARSDRKPQLVVFLRHSGCTFCREALADLAAQRAHIETRGAEPVVVHLGDDAAFADLLGRYGLADLPRIHDPDALLYRAAGLERGRFGQLFGPRIWLHGFKAAILARHGLGMLSGDGFRLGGVLLVDAGKIVAAHRHRDAADRSDYCTLATPAT